ncbi:uncharacterized protein EAF01_001958 [Botrytis porri]|uniref:Major facilitator superfamily (MFS) profile domain-containing protein n=1 Tax=Botrytis porri TaxID=87229 RepID=A0A4Z1K9T7_9HELO|nr:uncharacterized protein EAF01_001958 [Botrytis porri]KAF7912937.1 hypothetical protein EAF01_001958 [Botrytis porri]TGO82218.1 hypothetical protein BPOR_0887g00040 [Botrytis porri]
MNEEPPSSPGQGNADSHPEPNSTKRHGWQFWAIFPGLCLASVLCALDSTILSTALPTITSNLNSSSSYVWVINAYTVTFTAIQPFYGQFADIFGRKVPLLLGFMALPLYMPFENSPFSAIPMVPFGILGGFWIAKVGYYRLNQVLGFALATVAIGCFSNLDQNSSTAVWVILQRVFAAGAGIVLTATLPAIQAPLLESDVATATAIWGFVQSLGFVCGVALPSSIFEAKFRSMIYTIDGDSLRRVLQARGAYEHALKVFITSLSKELQMQIVTLFVVSLKLVWEVGLAFAIFGLFSSFFVQDIEVE